MLDQKLYPFGMTLRNTELVRQWETEAATVMVSKEHGNGLRLRHRYQPESHSPSAVRRLRSEWKLQADPNSGSYLSIVDRQAPIKPDFFIKATHGYDNHQDEFHHYWHACNERGTASRKLLSKTRTLNSTPIVLFYGESKFLIPSATSGSSPQRSNSSIGFHLRRITV